MNSIRRGSVTDKKISLFRRAFPQILAVSVKNILLLGFGTTVGFPTMLIGSFSERNADEVISINAEGLSWIGSITYLCNPIGCLLSGLITQPIGRRRSMQLVTLPYLIAWLLFHFSTKPWHVFLALGILGFTGGLLEAPVLTYVAEITEPSLRGALSSTSIMTINLGVLLTFILGTFLEWRTMALVNATIPLLAFVLLIFIPESPYWLIAQNRLDEAKKSLAWLRGWLTTDAVQEEYFAIYGNLQKHPMHSGAVFNNFRWRAYLKPSFWKPFLLINFAFILGHFGNTPLTVYAIQIFNLLQVPINSYFATIYIGVAQLLAVIVCVFAIKYLGKRILTHISMLGIFVCIVVTAVYGHVIEAKYFADTQTVDTSSALHWLPLVTLIGQAFFTYLCIKGLPWILIGELFDNDVRAFGSGFSAATGYVFGFASNKLFLKFVEFASFPNVLVFYAAIALGGFLVLHLLLPETEGKSLAQISEHYAGGNKLNKKIGRRTDAFEQQL